MKYGFGAPEDARVMMSTGVEALDSRLGGIARGGHFLVTGPEGAGKSVLALHFLISGLDRGERCVLVTGSDSDTLDSRGLFVGFSPGPVSRNGNLRVVDINDAVTDRGLGLHRNAPVEALKQVLQEEGGADRIVLDDLTHFAQASSSPVGVLEALAQYLGDTAAAAYVLASTSNGGPRTEDLEPVRRSASAVIALEPAGRGRRRFTFREVRQPAFSDQPFLYTLRSGGGFAEDLPAYDREVERELRRRVVILDETGTVPTEVVAALSSSFELDVFTELDSSFIELLEARYGVLVLCVDPYDPERAFNLTYTLRKSGNGAPILFVSPSRGLRSMTRSRGLRMGGDDFLLSELPPAEIVERIRITAHRGHHRRNGSVRPERYLQPVSDTGDLRPMTGAEVQEALRDLLRETPSPFFALAILNPSTPDVSVEELWEAVRPQVRLRDGDLLGFLPDGTIGLILAQVDAELAQKVLARVRRSHDALANAGLPVLFTNPLQSEAVREWTERLEPQGATDG